MSFNSHNFVLSFSISLLAIQPDSLAFDIPPRVLKLWQSHPTEERRLATFTQDSDFVVKILQT